MTLQNDSRTAKTVRLIQRQMPNQSLELTNEMFDVRCATFDVDTTHWHGLSLSG